MKTEWKAVGSIEDNNYGGKTGYWHLRKKLLRILLLFYFSEKSVFTYHFSLPGSKGR